MIPICYFEAHCSVLMTSETYATELKISTITLTTLKALPSILNFEKDKERLEKLKEESKSLREEIVGLQEELAAFRNEKKNGRTSISVQTNYVSIGEECDYLVVNTK